MTKTMLMPVSNHVQFTDEASIQFDMCMQFLGDIEDVAIRAKLLTTLQIGFETIARFGSPSQPSRVYQDFAPLSFGWQAGKGSLAGGLIYHGPHDGFGSGGAPTYSVSIDNVNGWSIHT